MFYINIKYFKFVGGNVMSSKKLGLVPRLIIAIIVGILIGQFMPLWIVRIFKTFSTFFGSFLSFFIK